MKVRFIKDFAKYSEGDTIEAGAYLGGILVAQEIAERVMEDGEEVPEEKKKKKPKP